MAETFYIYTLDDLNGSLTEGDLTSVAGDASPTIVHVDDNDGDLLLDTATSNDPDQVLAADFVVDGVTLGFAGDSIAISSEVSIDNYSQAVYGGTFSIITINGIVVGFTSTLPLAPGDALGIGPTSTMPDPQGYADLAACFTRDTPILCAHGAELVQDLAAGMRVQTRNNGLQPVRWVGHQKTDGRGVLAPVRIKKGALGNSADLLVSPMHRMLISGPRAELLFGVPELLAHARDLRDGDRIFSDPCDSVDYFHILFDAHQIISAYDCWSESFTPLNIAPEAFDHKSQDELRTLFPHLGQGWQDARPTLTSQEVALLSAI